jgi:transposase
MNNSLNVINERVDDLPLLLAQLKQMGVSEQLDKHFPTHGNWQGLSLGWVAIVWLSYILSQADHRLSHVQPWAEKRLETLRVCTDLELFALDFTDDRLEALLRYLSEDDPWRQFEQELGGNLVQVYDLSVERVRLDATTASGYFGVTEEGLFQWGHNKDHRPDLAQVKVMLSTLDPLGLPVATEVVAGNRADDPLYIPAVNRVRNTLNRRGLLYIGDCKMAAVATRAYIEAGGDYYLCPLPATQLATGELIGENPRRALGVRSTLSRKKKTHPARRVASRGIRDLPTLSSSRIASGRNKRKYSRAPYKTLWRQTGQSNSIEFSPAFCHLR